MPQHPEVVARIADSGEGGREVRQKGPRDSEGQSQVREAGRDQPHRLPLATHSGDQRPLSAKPIGDALYYTSQSESTTASSTAPIGGTIRGSFGTDRTKSRLPASATRSTRRSSGSTSANRSASHTSSR